MTVPQMRKEIISRTKPSRTANGKPIYTLPSGKIVSKAKKGELESYLAQLDANDVGKAILHAIRDNERLINRYNRKARKYEARRPRPNNIRLSLYWREKAKQLETFREAA